MYAILIQSQWKQCAGEEVEETMVEWNEANRRENNFRVFVNDASFCCLRHHRCENRNIFVRSSSTEVAVAVAAGRDSIMLERMNCYLMCIDINVFVRSLVVTYRIVDNNNIINQSNVTNESNLFAFSFWFLLLRFPFLTQLWCCIIRITNPFCIIK